MRSSLRRQPWTNLATTCQFRRGPGSALTATSQAPSTLLPGPVATVEAMKRIALWFSGTTTVLLALFSYHTSTSGAAVSQATGTVAAAGVVTAPTGTASPATGTSTTKTVNGAAVPTRYGDVQVQVVVSGTKVVRATAIAYSTNGRDGEINAYAIPVLQQETLAAQSASIDTVSGATYTSQGYIQSLQSALDAAHA